ncbi:MAG: hypothetical protein MJB14_09535, partial [Spirochaetes bacterium]|nr:hypothetical protein [Spirochaetota bacterium]
MKNKITILIFLLIILFQNYSDQWRINKSSNYLRITDCIIRDIDGDQIDEIIIASYSFKGKFIDIYRLKNGQLLLLDKKKVPKQTIFFDVGDIDNDKKTDIVFLASDGLYFSPISENLRLPNVPDFYTETPKDQVSQYRYIPHIHSELVVSQPELLADVPLVVDLDGNGTNELIIENIRAIEIYDTKNFKKTATIDLESILEFSLVPGQIYPHYIFYTLPIIQITDIDNDNKKEIITKFPRSMNIYSHQGINNWQLKKRVIVNEDNVYFLSDSFVKFSFPVIEDLNGDHIKELIISSANLDMPRLRFEAVGDVYYFNKEDISRHTNSRIVVKGIPLNLPRFFHISSMKNKDLLVPAIPFNLFSIFGILSGQGNIDVPFLYYQQSDNGSYEDFKPKKAFEIPFRIENIMSFVEEVPFDQYQKGKFPDFYYFDHKLKDKKVNILHYYYGKKSYADEVIATLDIPAYTPELPANLKLGNFTN